MPNEIKNGIQMIFCNDGLVIDNVGRYFQSKKTDNIEGFIEIEVPKDPETQFCGPEFGLQEIFVGPIDIMSLFNIEAGVSVKPYRKLNEFEVRVLKLAIKKELKVDFDKAKQLLSLEGLVDDDVNQNIQSSPKTIRKVRKAVTGGTVMISTDSACISSR